MTIPSTTAGAPGRVRAPIATIVRRLAVVSALALALFGVNVSTASASKGDIDIQTRHGFAHFQSFGEILTVGNLIPNHGRGVRAILSWGNTVPSFHRATVSVKPGDLFENHRNLSIREGTKVWLTMCYTKHGHNVKCSHARRGEA